MKTSKDFEKNFTINYIPVFIRKQEENSTTAYFTNIQLLDRNEIIFILINVNVCAFVHDDNLSG